MSEMRDHTQTELDCLLAEGIDGAVERERTCFDSLAGPFVESIVLFGASKLGRLMLAGLRQVGIEPLAFCDNSSSLWGQDIDGVPVFSPVEAASRFGESAVFVTTIWGRGSKESVREREAQLRTLGCRRVVSFGPLFWKYPDVFLPRIPATDLPHKVQEQGSSIRSAFELLADQQSRREFVGQLRWRLLFDFDALPDPASGPIYFPREVSRPGRDEVFVDCGAFDGDTVTEFLHQWDSQFREVIAFEPDSLSFQKLTLTIDKLPSPVRSRIRAVAAAVGDRAGSVRFPSTGGLGSAVGAGGEEAPQVTLDDALSDCSPTYIKMDIEGAELQALQGARVLIERDAPVLAVCAYHVQDHLWKLPLTMHSLNPDYRIFIRPHIGMVEDLVCYAAPRSRTEI
jgi:FkbM family methyltransferase